MSGITWGPAIEVAGVRPEWLAPTQRVSNKYHGSWNHEEVGAQADWLNWDVVEAIRLPANHPHYRTEKPAEAPLGVLTGVERVERLEALVRRLAKTQYYSLADQAEARALCPEPEVDPDLLKAREVALRHFCPALYSESGTSYATNQGNFDSSAYMRAIVEGIKAGREKGK